MSTALKQRTLELVQADRLAQLTPPVCGKVPNATLTVTFNNSHVPTLHFSASKHRLAYLPAVFSRSVRFHANARQFENAYHTVFDGLYLIEPEVACSDVGASIRKLGKVLPAELWRELHRHGALVSETKDSVAITIQRDDRKYLFPLDFSAVLDIDKH